MHHHRQIPPNATWDALEALFESLAETPHQREAICWSITSTRDLAPFLSKQELLREILSVGLLLLPVEDRPSDWPWLRGRLKAPCSN